MFKHLHKYQAKAIKTNVMHSSKKLRGLSALCLIQKFSNHKSKVTIQKTAAEKNLLLTS